MARKVDRIGEEIGALRLANDGSAAAFERTRQALSSAVQRMVVAGAQLAGQSGNSAFAPDLVETFERLLGGKLGPDPLCLAKEAVLAALTELGHDDPDVYLRGLRVRQFDPAYGVPPPGEESAGAVRSISALKLPTTGLNMEDLLRSLGPMLFDSSPHVRQNVVRALGACGSWEATLLIELKLTAGDGEPGVTGECFLELLNSDIDRYLPLVTEYLNDFNPEVRLQAICTLSECRNPLGVEALLAPVGPFFDSGDLEQIYFALGRCRHETATAFLNDSLANGSKIEIDLARRALAQRSVPA